MTIRIDDELKILYAERDKLYKRIDDCIKRQDRETGITADTIHSVREILIDRELEAADSQTVRDFISDDFENMTYKEILSHIDYDDLIMEEPCVKKMLKEHADHVLLSKTYI